MRVENIMSNWFLSVNKSDTASSCEGRQHSKVKTNQGIQGTARDPTPQLTERTTSLMRMVGVLLLLGEPGMSHWL